jgi:3D (Asp-Asp-Asp) domain-containing protein
MPARATLPRGYIPLHRSRRAIHRLPRTVAMALPLAAVGAAVLLPVAGATPNAAARPVAALRATLVDASTGPAPTSPGAVAGFGTASDLGAPGGDLAAPVVAMARTPSGTGYWLAAADGGVFVYGDAAYHGSLGGVALDKPIVGMAATPDGGGYWLVAADGGVFSFGDAAYHGSLGGVALDKPIVGMAATPDGGGYWLVAADGGVFSFGDAAYHGSAGAVHLASPIVGIAPTATGDGYWLAGADGGVFGFGDAVYRGGLAGERLARPVTAIAASPTGDGYWLAGADGGVFAFGDALYSGSLSPEPSTTAVVAIAPGLDDHSYWTATAPSKPAPTESAASTPMRALGDFTVTCYDNYGTTASGATTSTSTVAVDPSVIPLGTTIDIAGVGERVAQDTGGAVRGDHVDIWEPSATACDDWGVQTREVYVVG